MFLWFGLAPWVLGIAFVLFVVITTLVELERYGWSTTLIIAGIVLCNILHVFSVVNFFKYHFWTTMLYSLYYMGLGTGWSTTKWCLFLLRFKEERQAKLDEFHENQREARECFAADDAYRNDPEILTQTDYQYLRNCYYKSTRLSRAPRIRDYKSKFISWLVFWPFSFVGTIFHDLVKRIATWIYERLNKGLQKMSDKMVGDFPEPPEAND